MPMTWWISIVADAFGLTPRQARAEIEESDGLLEDVMEARAFVQAHRSMKDKAIGEFEATRMTDMVSEIGFALAGAELSGRAS